MKKTTKLIVGIICVVLGIALVFGAVPIVEKLSANKETVVVVTQSVTKGQKLTAEDLELKEISMNNIREDIAKEKDYKSLVGKYALVDLKKGDFLTGEKCGATLSASDQELASLPKGKQAYSVTFSGLSSSVSNKIEAGDIICCYITDTAKASANIEDATFVDKNLQYLRVLAVTDSSGVDTGAGSTSTSVSSTVTLVLNPLQIRTLASYSKAGGHTISFSVVYRGNKTQADKYLAKQEQIFTK